MSMENVCWYATQASWHFMLTVVAAYCRKFSAQLFTFPWSKSAKKCAIVADLHTIDYKNASSKATLQRTSNSHSRSGRRSLSHSPSSGLFAASWCLPRTPKGASSAEDVQIEEKKCQKLEENQDVGAQTVKEDKSFVELLVQNVWRSQQGNLK